MTNKLKRAQSIIESIYSTTIGNSSNPPSMSFYQSDTYRFFSYFHLCMNTLMEVRYLKNMQFH